MTESDVEEIAEKDIKFHDGVSKICIAQRGLLVYERSKKHVHTLKDTYSHDHFFHPHARARAQTHTNTSTDTHTRARSRAFPHTHELSFNNLLGDLYVLSSSKALWLVNQYVRWRRQKALMCA